MMEWAKKNSIVQNHTSMWAPSGTSTMARRR
jgi:hypothetical protein